MIEGAFRWEGYQTSFSFFYISEFAPLLLRVQFSCLQNKIEKNPV
ncbi:hypothetical protein HMPREF0198_2154 [Cardiobacterium hominis ATCC 15826]|uniref:Uncharacterized protein n=1 Tax=Cardiobacterium hominis (strain ATCC 15826 / DSM 8339 / NCTC 10426 / 6573) TaxID=638300 RepID=C8NCC6_CARH6|nr:hypothetical protein HMPREF0198_2154 [Cardiobacterium hominis ATCC 15826]